MQPNILPDFPPSSTATRNIFMELGPDAVGSIGCCNKVGFPVFWMGETGLGNDVGGWGALVVGIWLGIGPGLKQAVKDIAKKTRVKVFQEKRTIFPL